MYKFTNGIVVFDAETRDKYIEAGMVLEKEENKENGKVQDNPIGRGAREVRRDAERDEKANDKQRPTSNKATDAKKPFKIG